MNRKTLNFIVWILFLSVVIFGIEIVTPQGVGEAILYVGAILAGLPSRNRKIIYGAFVLSSILTVAGHFISPVSFEPWKSIINRAFAITVFGIVTFVGVKRIQGEESLLKSEERFRKLNIDLEQRISERTTNLQITNEQLQDELTLRKQTEIRYRSLYEQSNDAVFLLDLQGRHIGANSRAAEMLGYTVQEIQKLSVRDLSAEIEKSEGVMSQLLAGERVPVFERLFRKKNGEVFPVEINVELVKDDSGHPLHIQSIVRDITKRKQNEAITRWRNKMLSDLHQITLDLLKQENFESLLSNMVQSCSQLLDAPFAEILTIEGDELVTVAATARISKLLNDRVRSEEASLSWQAYTTRQTVIVADYSAWSRKRDVYAEYSLHAVADIPILNGDRCVGVLSLGRDQSNYEFSEEQIQFGNLFASVAALMLDNTHLRETLKEQSIRDSLTGLFNRRYMEETLQREISRATRQLHPLGIIMIDIDHFKQFNDTFGHAAGDRLLQEMGGFLQAHVRGEDIACRYGGEEFILILPDAELGAVQQRAGQLRLEAKGIQSAGQGITISLGIALYPQHGRAIKDVLHAADAALYRAKQNGRDRVATAETLE
ncbi:MAG: diguanylate cyclase [Anaerolineales bacterium]|nr:diguanylate cyclase [Anaerolineales bacterium]